METTMGSWEKVDDLLEEIEHLRYYLSEDEFKDVFVKEKFNQRVVESLRRERRERLHREKQPVIIVQENTSNETSNTTTSTECDKPDDFEINETVEQSKKRKGKNIINSPPHETNKCDNKCDDFEINERVEQSRKRKGKNIISSNKRLKQEKKSKKKKTVFRKKKDGNRHGGPIVEELPREYIESINMLNGREVKLVAQKKLTSTDVSEYHNRVTFSENNEVINNDFLNIQEIQILRRKEKLCVRLLVPSNLDGGVTTMVSMSKWEMNGNWYYAFVTPWKKVVLENGFKAGQVVQVWSFRYDDGEGVDRLGFAVVRVHDAGQSSGGSSGVGQSSGSSDGVKTYEVGESSGGGKGVEIHEVGESSGGGKDVEIHDVGQSNGGSNGGDSGGGSSGGGCGSGGSTDSSCGSGGDGSDGNGSSVVRKGSDGRVIRIRFKGVRICNDS